MFELSDNEIDEIFQSMQNPFDALAPLPYLSSIYKIGNALVKKQSLDKVKSKLTPGHIENIWCTLTSVSKSVFYSVDPNKKSLEACQHWITQDIELLDHIGHNALMQVGQNNENAARQVLILFIRAHLKNKEAFVGFNYYSLTQGAAEHTNESSVWPVIKKCSHLPIELIKQLGKNSSKIAKNILLDIQPHPEAKSIEAFFQEHHHWPKPIIKQNPLAIASSSKILLGKASPRVSSFLQAYSTLLDILAVVSSGLLYLFRASLTRVIPIAPYAAAPILTLYGLYRLKNYYDDTHKNQATPPKKLSLHG